MSSVMKTVGQLGGAWTAHEVLQHDHGLYGLEAGDGILTKAELFERIQTLKVAGKSALTESRLASAEKLYNAMAEKGADMVQYLPDELMELPESTRQVATALLTAKGTSSFSPLLIDEAINEAGTLNLPSPAAMFSNQGRLERLHQIRDALYGPGDAGAAGSIEPVSPPEDAQA
jgi:hypothetical protein